MKPTATNEAVQKPTEGFRKDDAKRLQAIEQTVTNYTQGETKYMHPADRVTLCDTLARRYADDAKYWRARNDREGLPERTA